MSILKIRDENGNITEIPALRGPGGKTAYQYAVDGGFTGTEAEFMQLLGTVGNNVTSVNGKTGAVTLSPSDMGIIATAAELNYVDGVTSNIQTQLNGKLGDFTIQIYNGTGGNPKPVKFASFNYTSCGSENGIAAKISLVSGHGNGSSYAFLEDAIIRVNYQGGVEVDNFKYYGAATGTYDGANRQFGDIFWVHDATNKIVDFYVLMGQYSRVYQTPWKRLTYSTGGTVTQHTGCTVYSEGEKAWGNNSEFALLSDIPAPSTETWTFTYEDGSTVTKAVHVG
jgi:hypothetical protein